MSDPTNHEQCCDDQPGHDQPRHDQLGHSQSGHDQPGHRPGHGEPVNELIGRDRGQATTEYALILLAAALVGVLVIGWATAGGGAAAIGRLFDSAINAAIDQLG